jgi:hypothetical protein
LLFTLRVLTNGIFAWSQALAPLPKPVNETKSSKLKKQKTKDDKNAADALDAKLEAADRKLLDRESITISVSDSGTVLRCLEYVQSQTRDISTKF